MRYSREEPPLSTVHPIRDFFSIVLLFCLMSVNALAQESPKAITGLDFGLVKEICIDDLFFATDIKVKPPVVPVGCTLIDCCPSCGFTPDLNVSIKLSSALDTEVEVRFDNLADPSLLTLRPPGAATWSGNTLKVARDVVVSGFRRDPTTPAVMAHTELKLTDNLTAGGISLSEVTSLEDAIVAVAISAGDIPLSEYDFNVRPRLCSPGVFYPPPPGDFITLLNNTGADASVVMLDARTAAGCVDDRRSATATSTAYENVLAANTTCRNEVSVYSRQDAAVLLDNVNTGTWAEWKDTAGDIQDVNLNQAPWEMPSNVWISAPDTTAEVFQLNIMLSALLNFPLVFNPANTPALLKTRAEMEFDHADMLFDLNKAGIDVNEEANFKIVDNFFGMFAIYATALALHNTGQCSMTQILNFQKTVVPGDAIYKHGELNVYYVAADWLTEFYTNPITGLECPGVVFIGTGGNETSLTHELGHVFSLRHVDNIGDGCDAVVGTDDFETNNIMWPLPAGISRDEFTIGQNFRMSFNSISGLNTLPTPAPARTAGATVSCPDGTDNEVCLCLSQR
ncbi:MAG: hypothetical protein ACR2QT_05535 [Woeseiaceae bacterium]